VRKIKEVFRLRFELGLGVASDRPQLLHRPWNRSRVLQRAEAVGVSWPLGEDWDEDRLEAALFGDRPAPPGGATDARLRRASSATAVPSACDRTVATDLAASTVSDR
jgi:hypothetical protein